MLIKQEILLGKGARGAKGGGRGSSRVRRTALPWGSQSLVYGGGISFRVVFSQSFRLRVHPGGTPCAAKVDASKKDSGRGSGMWALFLTFPKLFWLVVAY